MKKSLQAERFAIDRASVRTIDENGFMHVSVSPLTRVQVAPYYGREIVDWEQNGLDPGKIYQVYRPAEELSKPETIRSVNGIPIQANHHVDMADAPAKDTRVGATGDQAAFKAPYLMNSLHIYDKEAQDAINSGAMRELSLCYSYRPDFTPGETEGGEKYDLVMRDIIANHVALVAEGRAGPKVLVLDHSMRMSNMSENLKQKNGPVVAQETQVAAVKPDEAKTVDQEPAQEPATVEPTAAPAAEPAGEKAKDDVATLLAGVFSPEQIEALRKAFAVQEAADGEPVAVEPAKADTAKDTDEEDVVKALAVMGLEATPDLIKAFNAGARFAAPAAADNCAKAADEVDKAEAQPQKAQDADSIRHAVRMAVAEEMQAIQDVRGVLGTVKMGAYDSAAGIYKAALSQLGIKGVKPSEARAAFFAYQRGKSASATVIKAQDSAPNSSGVSRILNAVHVDAN